MHCVPRSSQSHADTMDTVTLKWNAKNSICPKGIRFQKEPVSNRKSDAMLVMLPNVRHR